MSKISRRAFVETTGAGLVVATSVPLAVQEVAAQETATPNSPPAPRTSIKLIVNGTEHRVEVEDRWTLVEVLRDHLNLTGTKIGCDRGEGGACTVLLEGKPVYSCSHLAAWMDGKSIQTVEGLEQNGKLDPLQQSFMDHDAPQCGYCTSGQLMSAKACLSQHPRATRDEVRAAMTGTICRCSNYNRYVEATLAVAGTETAAKVAMFDAASEGPMKALNTVGKATTRIDARQRVTGKATYTPDVNLPGMLYARRLRR